MILDGDDPPADKAKTGPPRQFGHLVRERVDTHEVKTVVIDSLKGDRAAMQDEHALILPWRELPRYLARQGTTTFLTVAQHGLVGVAQAPVEITCLADTDAMFSDEPA